LTIEIAKAMSHRQAQPPPRDLVAGGEGVEVARELGRDLASNTIEVGREYRLAVPVHIVRSLPQPCLAGYLFRHVDLPSCRRRGGALAGAPAVLRSLLDPT
jgi:hypothetical protein